MASTYMNSFYLLGDDDSADVSELYDSMKNKALLEVPSSPPKTRKQYTVFVEEPEPLVYEDGTYVTPVQSNGYGQRFYRNGGQRYGGRGRGRGNYHRGQYGNGYDNSKGDDNKLEDGDQRARRNWNWNDGGNRRGRGNGGYPRRGRGRLEYRRIDNGGVQQSDINGDVAGVSQSNANSEGESGVTFESSNVKEAGVNKTDEEVNNGEEAGVKKTVEEVSNGEEAGIKKTVEQVNGDVPEPEETPEDRKKREIAELKKKEREEKRRKWEEEEAEEARKMTLDQYEKLVLAKKEALNLQKEEARRVVAADEDLENMKLVGKKQYIDDILIVGKEKPKAKAVLDKPVSINSEETLEKSDSLDKKGHKPVAVIVAKLFEGASFGGGRGRRGGNQSGFGHRFPYRGGRTGSNGRVKFPTEKDFPLLGSAAHKPETVPSATLANAPAPSGTNSSTPDQSAASSSPSGSRVNPRSGNRASTRGATTQSASARSDSVKAEQ